ncbi:DHH family phosphoesterase [Shewanella sp. D64]|uniref:DHHA1 domain-containing protein n=1 Tax=unclassified Shewanella TaxID=196818 RepID=UPI0022BA1FC1|nr:MULTISPECIES: DHH family phosphoesterase [unclassified Shewanella]MEC4727757.1 DHH family phosphoesterase [Shewanella sp. D64]MEC4737520.1 DHH family phosphoesterase [Shewanella sp. E94]WBJ97329.1 DHH family phosphoesterase [Shewanella sp. MTB7]
MNYDIFNGDADGIIALLQLRLAYPLSAELVTGVKRDIELLEPLTTSVTLTPQDSLTVLDISMERNKSGLLKALKSGANVYYADHHRSGDIPLAANLEAYVDLDADTCTSLIVDKYLQARFHYWAITAAYGDNLVAKADLLSNEVGLSLSQAKQLNELGTLINYNGYGAHIDELHFHPAALYKALLKYTSPFDVIADVNSPFYLLKDAYRQDMDRALTVTPFYHSQVLSLFELADAAWARRVSGVYGNKLANQNPDSAHGVFTENSDGSYTVSLRAPLSNKQGAGDICSQFDTGGGRAAAAGINRLSRADVTRFTQAVERYYG